MTHEFIERMRGRASATAMVWNGEVWSYARFVDAIDAWQKRIELELPQRPVVAVNGDYSPTACAAVLALAAARRIVVSLGPTSRAQHTEFSKLAGVQGTIRIADNGGASIERLAVSSVHPLLRSLVDRNVPGLVLFSSASTGKSKAAVHDFERLVSKYANSTRPATTLAFLQIDHIGGLNTMLHVLAAGGTIATVADRSPEAVCAAISKYSVEVLPTSPTFLNMLVVSGAYKNHDLSCLRLVTYGTEVMPASTLAALQRALPNVKLLQTYGMTETGILRTRSREPGSLWMEIGGAGVETKIVDGRLWVRSPTSMLGYLNAPSPFDADGWINTQDMVEVDGNYLRVLGRETDVINVGGLKVYPAEVEDVILCDANVADAVVYGLPSPITGQVVAARIRLRTSEEPTVVQQRVRALCAGKLARYKIPLRIDLVDDVGVTGRHKKTRVAQLAPDIAVGGAE